MYCDIIQKRNFYDFTTMHMYHFQMKKCKDTEENGRRWIVRSCELFRKLN